MFPFFNGKHIRKCICDKLLLDAIHRHNDVVNIIAINEQQSCNKKSSKRVDLDARIGFPNLLIDEMIIEPTADSYVLYENSVLGASLEAGKRSLKNTKLTLKELVPFS